MFYFERVVRIQTLNLLGFFTWTALKNRALNRLNISALAEFDVFLWNTLKAQKEIVAFTFLRWGKHCCPASWEARRLFPMLPSFGIHSISSRRRRRLLSCNHSRLARTDGQLCPAAHNNRGVSRQRVSGTKAFCQAPVCCRKSCLAGFMHYKSQIQEFQFKVQSGGVVSRIWNWMVPDFILVVMVCQPFVSPAQVTGWNAALACERLKGRHKYDVIAARPTHI